MHIVSKFHDYYDSAAKYGKDMTVVYERKEMQFDLRDRDLPPVVVGIKDKIADILAKSSRHGYISPTWFVRPRSTYGIRNEAGDLFDCEMVCVFFCGKLHIGYRVNISRRRTPYAAYDTEYFYSIDSMAKFFAKENIDIENSGSKYSESYRSSWATRFNMSGGEALRDYLIENKVTVAIIDGHHLTVNPQLDKYQFYKAYDCVTAYQEIDMWISGTLSYPQNVVIDIDDKYKIVEHGFDKWSFRKMPEKRRA